MVHFIPVKYGIELSIAYKLLPSAIQQFCGSYHTFMKGVVLWTHKQSLFSSHVCFKKNFMF